ncbi:MAG TPA: hypothetical protein VN577_15375 [Terriglobales bacterium]|nr:hypothetical protein [Terriglobales bacterium]
MIDSAIIPANTVITAKGDGDPVDISSAENRVFLVSLDIVEAVEQESFDLSIFGSTDGQTWTPKALLEFPQQFYKSQTPILLDLRGEPDIRFVRAHWKVNRWGRGSETPAFTVSAKVREVPAAVLRETSAK